jgi:CRISPR-associated protein Cmr4
MSVWKETNLIGVYTLTPTHCGTGQTTGAIDLPIARDQSTGFPVLPATGLKGVARDYLTLGAVLSSEAIDDLFGKSLDDSNQADTLVAGRLAFTEARLVAYPVRSLNRPFLHVTCPLILERLVRDLRALGCEDLLGTNWQLPKADTAKVLVADENLNNKALVLEDLVYQGNEVAHWPDLAMLAASLATLLPAEETDSRTRLRDGLVVIPDTDFTDLMQRIIPVQARIKLTAGKTTDKWENPEGEVESGNLWYEEHLPPDCLFVFFVGERRQRSFAGSQSSKAANNNLETFRQQTSHLRVVQIGGNETVGQGLCYWTLWPAVSDTRPGGAA